MEICCLKGAVDPQELILHPLSAFNRKAQQFFNFGFCLASIREDQLQQT